MDPNRQQKYLGAAALLSVLFLAVSLAAFKVFSFDLFWHLRTGQWIVTNLQVPDQDSYSFTRQGMEWIDAQWLFQVILFEAYSLFGEYGTTLLQAALTAAATMLLVFSVPGRIPWGERALAGFVFVLALNVRIICRPELLSCVYMAAMFFVLERARRGRGAFLVAAPLIQLLFVNSEGIWPIGFGIVAVYACDLWLEAGRGRRVSERGPRMLPWALTLLAVGLVGLVQPYGWRGFIFPFTLLKETTLQSTVHKKLISDLMPIFHYTWFPLSFLPFLFLGALSAAAAMLAGRKVRPALFLLGIFFLYLALSARRNAGIASVALMQVLMAHLDLDLEARPSRLLAEKIVRWSALLAVIGSLFISVYSLALPRRNWDRSFRHPGFGIYWKGYPVGAAQFLKTIGYQGNIINGENLGGYLIWALWPDCRVFADTRMELGGPEAIVFYLQVFNDAQRFEAVARNMGVEAVVITFRPPYKKLFERLLGDKRWALVHLGWKAAVFLRRGARWGRVIERHEIKHPYDYEITVPED